MPSNTCDGGNRCDTCCIDCGSVEMGYNTPTNGERNAGIGQINHSDAGPSRSTIAHPKIPIAIPNKKRMRRNGKIIIP